MTHLTDAILVVIVFLLAGVVQAVLAAGLGTTLASLGIKVLVILLAA
jgi:hypothetical protein